MGCSSAKSLRSIPGAKVPPILADHTPEKVYSPMKMTDQRTQTKDSTTASHGDFEDRPTDSTTASHGEPLPADLWSLSDK